MKHTPEYRTWLAMKKFCEDAELTEAEWTDLGWLTLIDRSNPVFERGNIRWATSAKERADNRRFYQSLGPRMH